MCAVMSDEELVSRSHRSAEQNARMSTQCWGFRRSVVGDVDREDVLTVHPKVTEQGHNLRCVPQYLDRFEGFKTQLPFAVTRGGKLIGKDCAVEDFLGIMAVVEVEDSEAAARRVAQDPQIVREVDRVRDDANRIWRGRLQRSISVIDST